jgi:transposase-like protein
MKTTLPRLAAMLPDEAAAYEYLERLRWKGEPVCPHCGVKDSRHYFLKPSNGTSRATRTGAQSQRRVWKCRDCRRQFSVLTGTIFHGSKVPVRTWIFVLFEMAASKNGVSAREIERKYGLTPKTAWFVMHRLREAMKRDPAASLLTGVVVADETWIGGRPSNRHASKRAELGKGVSDKTPVLTIIHPESGEARSHVVRDVRASTLTPILFRETDQRETVLHTDESKSYIRFGKGAAGHETVIHMIGEYVRDGVTINQAENFFSQLKRSLDGTHHHVTVGHLPRYLAEHDYRYSTRKMSDGERMEAIAGQVAGRRIRYADTVLSAHGRSSA